MLFYFSALVIHYWKNRAQIQRPSPNSISASYLNLARSLLIGVIVLVCACCALTAMYIPTMLYIASPPEGMQVALTQSETAQVNQIFVMELEISNGGDRLLPINRVFLQMPGFPSPMETLAFLISDPPSALQNLNGALYLDFDQTVAPGGSKRLTLYFMPTRSGDFYGDIYIMSGLHMWIQEVNLQVIEP